MFASQKISRARDAAEASHSAIVDQIIAYESGEISAEGFLVLFASLVASGQAWTLQGSYGRTASALISHGHLTPAGEITEAARTFLAEVDR